MHTLNINKTILIMKTQNIIKTDQTSQEVKNISPNSELLNLFQVEELEQRYEMGWIKGGSVEVEVECDTLTGCEVEAGAGIQF